MSKRKVQSSRTHITRGPLGGIHATTNTYAHEPRVGPSRATRFAAFTGISPWRPRRFAVAAWVAVLLIVLGQSTPAGVVLAAVSAAAVGGWYAWHRLSESPPVADRPAAPVPGAAWCDHCADWTVHPTEQHVA